MKSSPGLGFTLIELLVVVAIVGILSRGIVIKANDFLTRNAVTQVSSEIYKHLLQQRNYAVVGQGYTGTASTFYFVRTHIFGVGNSLFISSTEDGNNAKAYPTRYIDLSVGTTITYSTGVTAIIDFESGTGKSVIGNGTSVVPVTTDIRIGITSPNSSVGTSVIVRPNGLIDKL